MLFSTLIKSRLRSALLVTFTLTGCGAESTPDSTPPIPVAAALEASEPESSSTAAISTGAAASKASIGGFRLTVPASWQRAELSDLQRGFVDAKFEVPSASREVQITLSTIGGGLQANVERWFTQFTLPEGALPKTELLTVDDIPVTWVDLQGTFRSMSGAEQDNWRMLGAAFDGQPQQFYIKLTGPEPAVSSLEDAFRSFVKSARRGK